MIRSDSLTMPTTLRSPSTTGTAPFSVFESSPIAARASSSGETDGTSVSMISPAVFIAVARLFDPRVGTHSHRDRVDHIGGDHRLRRTEAGGGVTAGASVGKNAGAGGGKGIEAASQQGADDPGKHVAGA